MEQLTDTMIQFEALVKGNGGDAVPFSLKISSPEVDDEGDAFCWIDCPYIRSDLFKIRGYDEKQATELSLRFVSKWLQDDDVVLVDKSGRKIELPELPEFPDHANDRF